LTGVLVSHIHSFIHFWHAPLRVHSTKCKRLSSPPGPAGCPRTTWMKTIQQDLKSIILSPNEAIVVAQNHPLWRLMSTFGAMHS